jgi:hypothetical protein
LAEDFSRFLAVRLKFSGTDGCALRKAWYTSAVAPAVTGVERLVPPQVAQAFWPFLPSWRARVRFTAPAE